jgi:hypothetical protein
MIAKLSLAYRHDEQKRSDASPSASVAAGAASNDAAVARFTATVNSGTTTRTRSATSASDPAFVTPAIASPQQIQHARELREQIKQKYLNRESLPSALWCVGID